MALRIEDADPRTRCVLRGDEWEVAKDECVRILALAVAGDQVPMDRRPGTGELLWAQGVRLEAGRRGEVVWAQDGPLPATDPAVVQAQEDRWLLCRIAEALGPSVLDRWANDDGRDEPDLVAEVRAAVDRATLPPRRWRVS